jgi:hypothetical protein
MNPTTQLYPIRLEREDGRSGAKIDFGYEMAEGEEK